MTNSIVNHYKNKFDEYGDSAKAVQWRFRESQLALQYPHAAGYD